MAKRVYVGECVGNRSVGRSWRKWSDSVNLNKRGLNVGQSRRIVYRKGADLRRGMLGA